MWRRDSWLLPEEVLACMPACHPSQAAHCDGMEKRPCPPPGCGACHAPCVRADACALKRLHACAGVQTGLLGRALAS